VKNNKLTLFGLFGFATILIASAFGFGLHDLLNLDPDMVLALVTPGAAGTCCRTVQQSLIDTMGANNDITLKIARPGLFEAIRSARNMAGFEQLEFQDPQGRTRVVQIKYLDATRTAAATARHDICVAGDTDGENFADVSLNYTRSVKMTMDDGEFQTFCTDMSEMQAGQLRKYLNQLYVGINTDANTDLVANVGAFLPASGLVAPLAVPLLTPAGAANHWGEIQIKNTFEDIENTERPYLIGSGILRDYTKIRDIACCNDQGVDISRGADFDYYRDNQLDTTVGTANNIIGFTPGAFQMASQTRYVGQYQHFEGNNAKTTIIDPLYNIPLDFTVYYNFCETEASRSFWVLTWSLNFGFFYIPDDIEPGGSPFAGVNNILHYQANCSEADVCS